MGVAISSSPDATVKPLLLFLLDPVLTKAAIPPRAAATVTPPKMSHNVLEPRPLGSWEMKALPGPCSKSSDERHSLGPLVAFGSEICRRGEERSGKSQQPPTGLESAFQLNKVHVLEVWQVCWHFSAVSVHETGAGRRESWRACLSWCMRCQQGKVAL